MMKAVVKDVMSAHPISVRETSSFKQPWLSVPRHGGWARACRRR